MNHLQRIISGGQTGADQAGWRAAQAAGLGTGGIMPPGYWTEAGHRPEFAAEYGATMLKARTLVEGIKLRTWLNVERSDATLWFGNPETRGGTATFRGLEEFDRPVQIVEHPLGPPNPFDVAAWIERGRFGVLNIAGNRESSAPGIGAWVEGFLLQVFAVLEGRPFIEWEPDQGPAVWAGRITVDHQILGQIEPGADPRQIAGAAHLQINLSGIELRLNGFAVGATGRYRSRTLDSCLETRAQVVEVEAKPPSVRLTGDPTPMVGPIGILLQDYHGTH